MDEGENNNNAWCVDLDGLCLANDDEHFMLEDIDRDAEEGNIQGNSKDGNTLPLETPDRQEIQPTATEESDSSSGKKTKTKTKKRTSFAIPLISSFASSFGANEGINHDATNDEKKETATVYSEESHTEETREIRAKVFMISGCQDNQTSADVSNVSSFSLPDPNGRAGGACTSALLRVLYSMHHHEKASTAMTFVEVLASMRRILSAEKYSQIPQLTSSQPMNVREPFYVVPPDCHGTKRAVLIGINYTGQTGELTGCHYDCLNMKDYLVNMCGFDKKNITVLMDDGKYGMPTRDNILQAYQNLVAASQSGDAAFCHYSGHGGRVRDDGDDETDGYDETLVPVDYSSAGQIRDDDLYTNLVGTMPSGVTLVSIMDCCHSATVLDLPYKYRANTTGEHELNPFSTNGGNLIITVFIIVSVIVVILVAVFQV